MNYANHQSRMGELWSTVCQHLKTLVNARAPDSQHGRDQKSWSKHTDLAGHYAEPVCLGAKLRVFVDAALLVASLEAVKLSSLRIMVVDQSSTSKNLGYQGRGFSGREKILQTFHRALEVQHFGRKPINKGEYTHEDS
ncbi:hypothetical protein V2J09_000591 [Rumex salicifolius]